VVTARDGIEGVIEVLRAQRPDRPYVERIVCNVLNEIGEYLKSMLP
jgi:hypothetical protein